MNLKEVIENQLRRSSHAEAGVPTAASGHKIALLIGYLLVALLAFNLGKITTFKPQAPEIKIEEPTIPLANHSQEQGIVQSTQTSTGNDPFDCTGKIKGNIGSSGKIYHLPGGAFYTRTNAEMCFNTETEAQAAGFRKSSR